MDKNWGSVFSEPYYFNLGCNMHHSRISSPSFPFLSQCSFFSSLSSLSLPLDCFIRNLHLIFPILVTLFELSHFNSISLLLPIAIFLSLPPSFFFLLSFSTIFIYPFTHSIFFRGFFSLSPRNILIWLFATPSFFLPSFSNLHPFIIHTPYLHSFSWSEVFSLKNSSLSLSL